MNDEILPHIQQHNTQEADWKLKVIVNTKHDALGHRVFLTHNGFKEYPAKISCHTCQDSTFYTTILPTHPTNQKHVQCETIHKQICGTFENHEYELELVTEQLEMNTLVCIESTKIDMGSIFLHEDIPVVVTLVQTTHHETFSNNTQNNQNTLLPTKQPHLILHISFSTKSNLTNIKKQIKQLEQLINWFDF